jgi:hypothetical protein
MHADHVVPYISAPHSDQRGGSVWPAAARPPWKVTHIEPVAARLARNTIIESTFEVGRRFRCTMHVDCEQLNPRAVRRGACGLAPAAMQSISSSR